ncbi:unnamed protein product [Effrenium voratum]|uniref:Uncharacterized protein n=1 Tax=Effrenium voratum TaxID=2562239 RepID=A0AA36N4A5_9DINO|nr:unnamed protein product [Effrenium voratum]
MRLATVRHAGRVFQVPVDQEELTAGELQVSVLLQAAGLRRQRIEGSPSDCGCRLTDSDAQIPPGLPEGSCELRLWCQMMPLDWSEVVPCSAEARIMDLRLRNGRPCRSSSSCHRCEQLASMHPLTARWQRLQKETDAAAALAALKAADAPFVVNIRSARRIASIVLEGCRPATTAAAVVAFCLRQCAAQRWPQCSSCRRLNNCDLHQEKLREQLLPAAIPDGTCAWQLWDGLARLDAEEDLRSFQGPRSGRVLVLVAKVDPKSPPCSGLECQRCAVLADAQPETAALRRRRHFWRLKRGAFLLRFGQCTEPTGLVMFLQRICPEVAFHLIVSYLFRVIFDGQMKEGRDPVEILYARVKKFMDMENQLRALSTRTGKEEVKTKKQPSKKMQELSVRIAHSLSNPTYEEVPAHERRCAGVNQKLEDDIKPKVLEGTVKGVGGVIEALQKKYAMIKGERLRVVNETKDLWKLEGEKTIPKCQVNTGWKWVIKGAQDEEKKKAEEAARKKAAKEEEARRKEAEAAKKSEETKEAKPKEKEKGKKEKEVAKKAEKKKEKEPKEKKENAKEAKSKKEDHGKGRTASKSKRKRSSDSEAETDSESRKKSKASKERKAKSKKKRRSSDGSDSSEESREKKARSKSRRKK